MFSKIAIGNILHNDQLLTTILKEPMKPNQIQVFNASQCLYLVPELVTHVLVIQILLSPFDSNEGAITELTSVYCPRTTLPNLQVGREVLCCFLDLWQ